MHPSFLRRRAFEGGHSCAQESSYSHDIRKNQNMNISPAVWVPYFSQTRSDELVVVVAAVVAKHSDPY